MELLESRRFILLALLLALLAACPFLPGLGGGFIFDDVPNIVENSALHLHSFSLDGIAQAAYSFQPGKGTRPLSMLSFSLDYLRGGLNPANYKSTNLLIHVITAFVLMVFLRRLFRLLGFGGAWGDVFALIVSVAWAVHPLQVSSVLYVVQRMQTLVTLFLLLAMWAYVEMRWAQMEGRRSRGWGILVILFWMLGLASKEDAALLPLYTLMLELTVLQFKAAHPSLARLWLRAYWTFAILGAVVFFFIVVPRHWQSGFYVSRDFSSWERLLTQPRVLVMYLGQILLPFPGGMPFYYDHIQVSRGLLRPITTLPSLLMIVALLAWALRWRRFRPLFSFGLLLYFSGHFMTSNVINLELAFEHRNHLPMLGVLLAVADLCLLAVSRWSAEASRWIAVPVLIGLVMLALATFERAKAWGDSIRFASSSVRAAPTSARAWLVLCGTYFERSGGRAESPYLGKAIETCTEGAKLTGSAPMLSNVVIFKTIRGDVQLADWQALLDRLREVRMNPQNQGIALITLDNLDRGIPLDESRVLDLFEIISSRAELAPRDYLRMGAYIHNSTQQPNMSLRYFVEAVKRYPPEDPAVSKLIAELRAAGRVEWASQLDKLRRSRTPAEKEAHPVADH